jgi:hypothetical protein
MFLPKTPFDYFWRGFTILDLFGDDTKSQIKRQSLGAKRTELPVYWRSILRWSYAPSASASVSRVGD